jgi:hypothetical protein
LGRGEFGAVATAGFRTAVAIEEKSISGRSKEGGPDPSRRRACHPGDLRDLGEEEKDAPPLHAGTLGPDRRGDDRRRERCEEQDEKRLPAGHARHGFDLWVLEGEDLRSY